jgi:hypothetical protein
LDGDGRPDAISVLLQQSGDATVAVRRGTDGHVIWQWSPQVHQCYIGAIAMRIGAPARPGIVLAYASQGTPMVTLHLVGIEPVTGEHLWEWSAAGIPDVCTDYSTSLQPVVFRCDVGGDGEGVGERRNLPAPALALGRRGGGPAKLLVTIDTAVRASQPSGAPRTLQVVIVSARDGSTTDAPPTYSAPKKFGDLDADGYADYIATAANGHPVAYSSTGQVLWQRGDLPPQQCCNYQDALPVSMGDLNGDGAPDLLFQRESNMVAGYDLVDGRRGYTIRQLPWTALFSVGDINGDGRLDLISEDSSHQPTGGNVSTVTAVTGLTGSVLWTRQFATSDDGIYFGDPAGDVDADGIQDLRLHNNNSAPFFDLSGRTGATSPYPGRYPSAFASIDGQGQDALTTTTEPDPWRVIATAYDGATGAQLWSVVREETQGDIPTASTFAADLSGDGHAEVLVNIGGYSTHTPPALDAVVIDGATGQIRWSLRATPEA